jgi:hypothetical protein
MQQGWLRVTTGSLPHTLPAQAAADALTLKDPLALQYCAAILHNLSQFEPLCKDMYDDGAVLLLVSLAKVRTPPYQHALLQSSLTSNPTSNVIHIRPATS